MRDVIRQLGLRRIQQAIPQLADIARGGQHNGRIAAILALKRIGAPAAESTLDSLERELGESFSAYFRRRPV